MCGGNGNTPEIQPESPSSPEAMRRTIATTSSSFSSLFQISSLRDGPWGGRLSFFFGFPKFFSEKPFRTFKNKQGAFQKCRGELLLLSLSFVGVVLWWWCVSQTLFQLGGHPPSLFTTSITVLVASPSCFCGGLAWIFLFFWILWHFFFSSLSFPFLSFSLLRLDSLPSSSIGLVRLLLSTKIFFLFFLVEK